MNLKDASNISELTRRSEIVWAGVCEYHYDHSAMSDGVCSECADDLHEAEIWARP